jgi:hypothetical protein
VITAVLVEALLQRGSAEDFEEVWGAIDRLAAAPLEPGLVLRDVPLLRLHALLARSATGLATGNSEIGTARWPPGWASKGTSRGPR